MRLSAEVFVEAIEICSPLLLHVVVAPCFPQHPLLPVWSVDSGGENRVVGRSLETGDSSGFFLPLPTPPLSAV